MGPGQAHRARPLRELSCLVYCQLLLLEQLPQVSRTYVLLVDGSFVLLADECYNSRAFAYDRSTVERVLACDW